MDKYILFLIDTHNFMVFFQDTYLLDEIEQAISSYNNDTALLMTYHDYALYALSHYDEGTLLYTDTNKGSKIYSMIVPDTEGQILQMFSHHNFDLQNLLINGYPKFIINKYLNEMILVLLKIEFNKYVIENNKFSKNGDEVLEYFNKFMTLTKNEFTFEGVTENNNKYLININDYCVAISSEEINLVILL